jgi:hypothetical protein
MIDTYIAFNRVTGRIAGPSLSYLSMEQWCETVESKGKHVAEVVFDDASLPATRRVKRMGSTIWNQGKHRGIYLAHLDFNYPTSPVSASRVGPNPFTN